MLAVSCRNLSKWSGADELLLLCSRLRNRVMHLLIVQTIISNLIILRQEHTVECTPCNKGDYKSLEGPGLCQPCDRGTYSNELNSTECLSCRPGHFQPELGQSDCEPCAIGSYCNKTRCVECEPCAAGRESLALAQVRCTPCEPGYYKMHMGYDLCRECDTGYVSVLAGARVCSQCPAGFYCSCKKCAPKPCPLDSVCPAGSVRYTVCSSPFYYAPSQEANSCKMTMQFYLLLFGSIFAVLLLSFVAFVSLRKKFARKNERAILMADKQQDVVYHGYWVFFCTFKYMHLFILAFNKHFTVRNSSVKSLSYLFGVETI